MKRRGFTLIELMMVISILAILVTIVVTSVSGSIKSARAQRTSAVCSMVQTGLATYYAQYDKWPDPLGSRVENGSFNERDDSYELTGDEVRKMVFALVKETKEGNPMIDVSALIVSRTNGERGSKGKAMDFFQAVHGSTDKEYNHRMSASDMYFGYADKDSGYFRRFKMVYSIPADQLSVMQQ